MTCPIEKLSRQCQKVLLLQPLPLGQDMHPQLEFFKIFLIAPQIHPVDYLTEHSTGLHSSLGKRERGTLLCSRNVHSVDSCRWMRSSEHIPRTIS